MPCRRDELLQAEIDSELLYAPSEEGQDPRHVDSIWPLWSLFDLTPDGRPSDWDVSLTY